MARRRRSTVPLTPGRGSYPSSAHSAAPGDFLPHDLLEDAATRARVRSDLSPRAWLRTVYQEGPLFGYARPLSPTKPREARLSVFSRNAPSLFAGLRVDRRVQFCVSRKIRRESLFAYKKIGYRGSSPGRRSKYNRKLYQRSGNSRYSCL